MAAVARTAPPISTARTSIENSSFLFFSGLSNPIDTSWLDKR
jgi:hypothetical protein